MALEGGKLMFEAVGVVVVLVALFGAAVVTLLVVAAVKAVKAVAAKVEKTEVQARRAVENVTLKAKTFAKPGPVGELSAVRLGLRTSLTGTREVLESGVATDAQLGESLGLLARLEAHAAELDGELRLLEREPDPARITARLPELRERADRITQSAGSLRWAAQERAHRFSADELNRLAEEVANEAGALRHWDTGGAGRAPEGGERAGEGAEPGAGAAGAGAASGAGAGAGGAAGGFGATLRAGLESGAGRVAAEDLLGNLAQRLRKPAPGSQGN
ncbi:hypothetical protein [Kitasatospora viridis]|uniref:Uncharacterized protein n=1 Tax=Kitasatospora viridis TaxID=281105 RepID=A0A561UL41_9ACTN|nr:hypothetical protein [Kitasatospora viridis]TWG00088.1 hypothetical protein FHX73_113957 [Kitasatospora viridis]